MSRVLYFINLVLSERNRSPWQIFMFRCSCRDPKQVESQTPSLLLYYWVYDSDTVHIILKCNFCVCLYIILEVTFGRDCISTTFLISIFSWGHIVFCGENGTSWPRFPPGLNRYLVCTTLGCLTAGRATGHSRDCQSRVGMQRKHPFSPSLCSW